MTQDEIIRMAREAGLGEPVNHDQWDADLPRLERFAALVAAHEREKCFDAAMKAAEKAVDTAMLLEREACAKFVDHILKEGGGTYGDAIRKRGEKNV